MRALHTQLVLDARGANGINQDHAKYPSPPPQKYSNMISQIYVDANQCKLVAVLL